MAIARVSSNDSDGGAAATPFTVAYTNPPASGNLLIILVASPNPTGSVSATGWTLIKEAPFQTNTRSAAILAKISAGAGDQSVSVNSTGGGTIQWNAFEYSGAASSIVQDGTSGASQDAGGTTTSLASASITLGNTGSLIIFARATSTTDGGGNTWTNGTLIAPNARNRLSVAEWLPGSGGAKSSTNSWTSAVRAGMAVAAFRPPVATTPKTTTGKSRIQITTLRTTQGLARVLATTLQTVQGLAKIQGAAATTQTVTGQSRIQIVTNQTTQGLARITSVVQQAITGLGRITASTVRTALGLARVTAQVLRTIQGKASIQIGSTQTVPGKARITAITPQNVAGKSRVLVTTTKNQLGLARIQTTATKNVTGIARIATEVYSMESKTALPVDNSRLANVYTRAQVTEADQDNAGYVDLSQNTRYGVHEFEYFVGLTPATFAVKWKGKSTRPASAGTVTMQLYNLNTSTWDTVATDSTTAAGTEMTLNANIASGYANYFDARGFIYARVYQ